MCHYLGWQLGSDMLELSELVDSDPEIKTRLMTKIKKAKTR